MTERAKHTPEPWVIYERDPLAFGRNEPFGEVGIATQWGGDSATAMANAHRIVECVNALEGIEDPSAVGELLAAAERAQFVLRGTVAAGRATSADIETLDSLDTAIANVEGRGRTEANDE